MLNISRLLKICILAITPAARQRISPNDAPDWFRFTIHNTSKQDQKLVINFNQIAKQRVDIFYNRKGHNEKSKNILQMNLRVFT